MSTQKAEIVPEGPKWCTPGTILIWCIFEQDEIHTLQVVLKVHDVLVECPLLVSSDQFGKVLDLYSNNDKQVRIKLGCTEASRRMRRRCHPRRASCAYIAGIGC